MSKTAALSQADLMFCMLKAWEHEFSREKGLKVWDSTGLSQLHHCGKSELKDQEERAL